MTSFRAIVTTAFVVLGIVGVQTLRAGPGEEEVKRDQKPVVEAADNDIAAARDAARKGADWLTSKQKENGSWSDESYPAMTALGLWAFCGSDHPDKAAICDKAAKFVTGFAQEDGGIYKPATGGRGSGGLSVYNTAICMTALQCYDSKTYAPIILKARAFVAGGQIQGDSPAAGGFGYERTPPAPPSKEEMVKRMEKMGKTPRADLSNTGWALMAMRATQDVEDTREAGSKRVDADWAAALKYIGQLQDTDKSDPENYGGFGYEASGERGGITAKNDGTVKLRNFGSMTYAGLESMIYAQLDKSDPRVSSSLQWASRHWSVDENPGQGSKGLYYYYTIMAKALSLMGGDTIPSEKGDPIPWKKQLAGKLVQLQGKDGSWSNPDNQFWENDPVLVTSYTLLVLQKCGVR